MTDQGFKILSDLDDKLKIEDDMMESLKEDEKYLITSTDFRNCTEK